jgi:cyclic pyranopterin phosphate synthase
MDVKMVDVGGKKITKRSALAQAEVYLQKETIEKIKDNQVPKGDVLNTARVAGILAAKNTPRILPLCHPLRLNYVELSFEITEEKLNIKARVEAEERTGVEMEALTAVSVAALTVYDMCKIIDQQILISNIYLIEKRGGKSDLRK